MTGSIGPIDARAAKYIAPDLSADASFSGNVVVKTVASNSIGFGALLRPSASGLVEAAVNVVPSLRGLFIALEAGIGSRRVMRWAEGSSVRNDSWSWTAGELLYLSTTPGIMSHSGEEGKDIGFAESSTEVVFGKDPGCFNTARIAITHTGQTLEAIIEVDAGATVLWEFADDTTSDSLHPTKDFGTAATRTTYLTVTPTSALTLLVVGYDAGDDGTLGDDYLLEQQNVPTITGVNSYANLVTFACSQNPITALEFGGCSALETIECYQCTSLDSIGLSGATSLQRLCLEGCSVETIDLSSCGNMRDWRGAGQGLQNITWPASMPYLWHLCIHNNELAANIPPSLIATMVAMRDFYLWDAQQSGALTLVGGNLRDVLIYNNAYTSLDVSAGFLDGTAATIDARNNALTSVNITGCSELVGIYLQTNALDEAAVDGILAEVESWGTSGGILNLSGNTAPSSTGLSDVATLEGRGWTVTVDASSNPYVTEFSPQDNATGVAVDTSFSITFNEAVYAGTGNIELYNGEGIVEQFDVASDVTGFETATISFTPSSSLSAGDDYYIMIDSTAIVDGESNPYAGIDDATTWNFTTASGSTLFSDDFNRSDGAVGNDWAGYLSPSSAISGYMLILNHDGYACLYNMAGDALPADYVFQCTVPHSMVSRSEWGVGVRCVMDGVPELTGIRIFFYASDPIIAGNTKAWNADSITITVTNGFPASWSTDQDHTVAIQCVGTTITIILDGQEYGYLTSSINNTTATGICFLGNPGGWAHHYDDAVVNPVS